MNPTSGPGELETVSLGGILNLLVYDVIRFSTTRIARTEPDYIPQLTHTPPCRFHLNMSHNGPNLSSPGTND